MCLLVLMDETGVSLLGLVILSLIYSPHVIPTDMKHWFNVVIGQRAVDLMNLWWLMLGSRKFFFFYTPFLNIRIYLLHLRPGFLCDWHASLIGSCSGGVRDGHSRCTWNIARISLLYAHEKHNIHVFLQCVSRKTFASYLQGPLISQERES